MRRRSYITNNESDNELLSDLLNDVLACLRAQYLSYQTSHWQVAGSHFYMEHQLFQRLYESVTEEVDVMAEKISGLVGSNRVSLQHQVPKMVSFLGSWASIPDHIRRGLTSEEVLQELLKSTYDAITEAGLMTLGLDDFLMATASSHETNIYLLQQTINPRADHVKTARRRRRLANQTDEDYFFVDPRKVEVQEFAQSNAVSNDPSTFENTLKEDRGHQTPLKVEVQEFEESPLTPNEVLELPGSEELSTLNRFVVDAEDPALEPAINMNEKREHQASVRRVLQAYKRRR